jgi:1-deoxy-D-xylulose 5-phosphate reductoisomerase
VAKFLNGDIGFCDIAGHVRATLEAGDYGIIADSFEAILALDREIRQR